jgi:hypothetical protein
MIAVVYTLLGFIQWDKDPANWTRDFRFLWVLWGIVWGFALQCRIARGGDPWIVGR